MSGFKEYEIEYLKEAGYTPESARNEVVKKLKKAGLKDNKLKQFLVPIDELNYTAVDTILNLTLWLKEQPEQWIKHSGKDFSDESNWMNFRMFIDY